MDVKLLANALREEARLVREEMHAVCSEYLKRIDHLNTEARRLENSDDSSSVYVSEPAWFTDWSVRVSDMRSKDAQ